MNDYISRVMAIARLTNVEVTNKLATMTDAKRVIAEMPAADVAPVVYSRWEDSIDEWFGTDVYTCSKCRESYVLVEGTPKQNLWHYCPNCGAKMDGGDGDVDGS